VLAGCHSYERVPLDLRAHAAEFEQRALQEVPLRGFVARLAAAGAKSPEVFDIADRVLGPGVTALTNGANWGELAAADFDLDGDIDLVTANSDGNSISVMENTGGAFAAGVVTAVGTFPSHLAAADLDGNGSPDLAVTNRDSNSTWVFLSGAGGGGDPTPCNAADLVEPFGVLDLADIQAFVVLFTGGCP
jgi:hypothetical protein